MANNDLNDMLAKLLSDPNTGAKLQQAMNVLSGGGGMGNQGNMQQSAPPPQNSVPVEAEVVEAATFPEEEVASSTASNNMPSVPNIDLGALMNMKSSMDSMGAQDSRVQLLNALRPYVSARRGQSLDQAVRMLKLTKMATMANQMGLFRDLFRS